MKTFKLLLAIFLVATIITSCSKKNSQGKMIPQDAGIVIDINTKSLTSKLSWDEIKQSNWFKELMADTSHSSAKVFIGDPKKTGIDLSEDIIMFLTKPMADGQFVIEGSIKDSKVFADFIKNAHPGIIATKDGELNVSASEKGALAWNDKNFAFVTSTEKPKFDSLNLFGDSTQKTIPLASKKDQLAAYAKKLFSLKEDSSLASNEKFGDLLKEDGEVHFWMNAKELASGNEAMGMMGMLKLDKFLDGNISTMTVSFDDGKMTGKNKFYAGKELTDILKKNSDGKMNSDLLKKISSKDVAMVFNVHFRPESFIEMIKLTGLDGFINLMLAQQGITLDDFAKGLKGDMMFALTDLKLNENPQKDTAYGMKADEGVKNIMSEGSFLFTTTIGDKDAFNKLMNAGKKMGSDTAMKDVFKKSDDKMFVVSNKQDVLNNYFIAKETDHAFLAKLKDHPFGLFVDLQNILKATQVNVKDSIEKISFAKNLSFWNNIYLYGGEFKDGGLVSTFEVNLVDDKTNSLKQLNKFADEMAALEKEKKKNYKGWSDSSIQNMIDSAVSKQSY